MKLGLSTGSVYTYGTERVFALAAEAGFDGMEVLIDYRWDTRQADYLRILSARYDLPIISLHTPFGLRVDGWGQGQLNYVLRTAELAQELGVRVIVAHLPMRWVELAGTISEPLRHVYLPLLWPRERAYARWLLKELTGFEQGTGLMIGVENMPISKEGPFLINRFALNQGRRFTDHIRRYPHLTMDTTHLGTWGVDLLDFYEQAKAKIVNIHLSNLADGKEHQLLWAGELRLGELVARLRSDGYQGNLVVELAPDALGAEEEQVVAQNLQKSVALCRGEANFA